MMIDLNIILGVATKVLKTKLDFLKLVIASKASFHSHIRSFSLVDVLLVFSIRGSVITSEVSLLT